MATTRPRVLLADDFPDLVKAVSRLLALDCEVVGTVADGDALLDIAQRLKPDVIVLDLTLPKLHGLDACRQVTQAHPEIRVVVFTAMSELDVGDRALEVGTSAFVSKLGGHRDLVSTIKRLCDVEIR